MRSPLGHSSVFASLSLSLSRSRHRDHGGGSYYTLSACDCFSFSLAGQSRRVDAQRMREITSSRLPLVPAPAPRCLFQQVVCAIIFCSPRSVVVPSHARCCCRCKPLEARTQLDDPSAALSSSCNAAEMDHAPGGDDGDSKKPARQYGKRLDRGGAGRRREGGRAKASHVPYRTYGKYMRIWVACVCL